MALKKIHIQYYALLREERGIQEEILTTHAQTVEELYIQLQKKFKFRLSTDLVRVSINNEFVDWNTSLTSEDQVVFIPPVAGG